MCSGHHYIGDDLGGAAESNTRAKDREEKTIASAFLAHLVDYVGSK